MATRLIDFTAVGGTHGGGSVDLVPAAEDEAGFGVVHPVKNENRDMKGVTSSEVAEQPRRNELLLTDTRAQLSKTEGICCPAGKRTRCCNLWNLSVQQEDVGGVTLSNQQ